MDFSTVNNQKNIFQKLIKLIKPYYAFITLGTIATLLKAFAALFTAYLIKSIADSVQQGKSSILINFVLLMIAITIIGVFAEYFKRFSSGRYSAFIVRDIQNKVFHHVEVSDLSDSSYKKHSGDIVSRATNDINQVSSFLSNDMYEIFYLPLVFIGGLSYLAFLNLQMLIFNILIALAVGLLSMFLGNSFSNYSEKLLKTQATSNSFSKDIIGGFYTIKALNLENVLNKKYETIISNVLKSSLKLELKIMIIRPVFMILNIFPIIACVFFGGYLVLHGKMSLSSLLTFLFMLNYILEPSLKIPVLMQNYNVFKGAAIRIFELLEQPEESDHLKEIITNFSDCAVEFKNVSFSYDGTTKVLENLTFEIPHGKTTAIVGTSGAGKSTILKLICSFDKPNKGNINFYGADLNNWDVKQARSLISIVQQETQLFPITISENIACKTKDVTFEQIVHAAKTADIHDFIDSLPDKYNTVLNDGALNLSGGQKQRISIARAILKNSPLIMMDEPTSAIDSTSESLIRKTFKEHSNKKTVIIIAHRLSTVKWADNIIVLDKGGIVDKGTHERLVNKPGLYRQLFLNSEHK